MAKTRRTYQPHKTKRINAHGFMSRNSTNGGKNVLKNRRSKGRHVLTVSDEVRPNKAKRFKKLK